MNDNNHKKKIAIIGLGRVGLPLALVFADKGFEVIGIDTDQKKIELLRLAKMPFLENGVDSLLKKHVGKNFKLGKFGQIKKCTSIVITVGTLLERDFSPNMGAFYEVLDSIIPFVQKDTMIVFRSTVEPNGTEKAIKYLKKKLSNKFYVIYAPERIAEGFALKELYNLPQIIGSLDEESAKRGEKLFKSFVPEIIHTDPLTAELAKLSLNTYRYAKFAIANELMMISDYYGRSIYDVLDVANYNYDRGFEGVFSKNGIPSPGLAAGPCLVKDSFFIKHNTPFNTMITGSFLINNGLPEYLVSKLSQEVDLAKSKVALLGLSFKRNVDDDRNSLSLKLLDVLRSKSKEVKVHDPFLRKGRLNKVLDSASVVVISVNHDFYKKLSLESIKQMTGVKTVVCDLWNILGNNRIFS